MQCKENWRSRIPLSTNNPGYATDQQWHGVACHSHTGLQACTQHEPAECRLRQRSSEFLSDGIRAAWPHCVQTKTIFNGLKSSALLRDGNCFNRTGPWSHLCISMTLLICRVAGRWRLLRCMVNTGFSNPTEIESFYCADK